MARALVVGSVLLTTGLYQLGGAMALVAYLVGVVWTVAYASALEDR